MTENSLTCDLRGRTLIDRDGAKIGKIHELYCNQEDDQPAWALVSSDLLDTSKTFVPIRRARKSGEDALVPFAKWQIKTAPRIEPDQELSEPEERRLYDHYGIPYTSEGPTTAIHPRIADGPSPDDATSRPNELGARTAPHERAPPPLRKYVEKPVATERVRREKDRQ